MIVPRLGRDAKTWQAAASRHDDRTAAEFLGRAVQVDASNIDAWEAYIQVEYRNAQYQNAETLAMRALSAHPRSEKLWTAASSLYEKEGLHDLAIIALENSVLCSSDSSSAASRLKANAQGLSRDGLQEVVQTTLAKPSIKAFLVSGSSAPPLQSGGSAVPSHT